MKTILIIAAVTVMSISVKAQMSKINYVVTKNDTTFCETLKVGEFKTLCVLENGEKIKFANRDIDLYANNGHLMQKLPVYFFTKKTQHTDMMELVEFRNGVKVYKDECYNGARECLDAVFYFYVENECVSSKKNPDLSQIKSFVDGYKKDEILSNQTNELVYH